jgi:DNA invertase Pin-like site-specific DNA recombinase
MTVAVYIRVSTSSLNEAGQMREVIKWLTGKGINPESVVWYIDRDSGEKLNRTEFEQLQRDIFSDAIKTVVVEAIFILKS